MRIKLKICGVTNLYDATQLDEVGVDFIGIITDPISLRYVQRSFVKDVMNIVKAKVVEVKVTSNIDEAAKSFADYVQIHRVLKDEELSSISKYSKKFIIYVPASLDYIPYLLKVQRYTDMVLFDSPVKGVRSDPRILKTLLDYHSDAGVGGEITLDNIYEYLALDPSWIDISSGVESSPGKKDVEKVKILKEVVASWRRKV